MPELKIVLDVDTEFGKRPVPADKIIHLPDPDMTFARIPRGMQSGKSSVMIDIRLPDGRVVMAETSMALFLAAAKAFAKSGGAPGMAPGGKGGPPGAGAPPAKPGDPKAAPAADAAVGARDVIEKEAGGWMVYSEGAGSERKKLGGPYPTKAGAVKRLAQVEYFKNA